MRPSLRPFDIMTPITEVSEDRTFAGISTIHSDCVRSFISGGAIVIKMERKMIFCTLPFREVRTRLDHGKRIMMFIGRQLKF